MSIPRHTAYNLAGGLLPVALSLVTIPLYIGLIGEARYGVLAIAWLMLGYFGLFDLGLGSATAQRIAALPEGQGRERSDVFWTAMAMNGGLGIVGALVIYPTARLYLGTGIAADLSLQQEIVQAMPWLACILPVAMVSGVLTGALQGRARFLELNVISMSGAALSQVLPLLVARLHGPGLQGLLAATVVSRLFLLVALYWRCRQHVFGAHPRAISRQHARGLLHFGGWITVSALVSPLMVMMDRFAVGSLLGAKAVAHYTVPFQLAERSTLLPGALAGALFPRLASIGIVEGRVLAGSALRSLTVIMTPLTAAGILLIDPFLRWWLNPEFAAQAALPGQILLLGFWINSLARVPHALLQAAGKPDTIAKCHLVEIVPYLVLLFIGLRLFGIAGAALVFGLRTLVDCLLLMHFAGTMRAGISLLMPTLLFLLACFALSREFPAEMSVPWVAAATLALGIALAWAVKNAPGELWGAVQRKLGG